MLVDNLTNFYSNNYFDLFGLPVKFDLDQKLLAMRCYELQQQFHPDHCINNKSAIEKKICLERCAFINKAWQILRQPLSRAVYILSIYGFDIIGNESSITDLSFLNEQLQLREECEKIEQQLNEVTLNNFINKINTLVSTLTVQIEKQMEYQKWEEAVKTVQKLQFLTKLRHHLDELENRLFNF
ncbi:MAG: Fe-S protein assembly co-chaperone HscB [Candidatus Dasytiphilus stammeri]